MNVTVKQIIESDKQEWQMLYRQYAEFYKVPMDDSILDTVWTWIFDDQTEFFGIIARDDSNQALGLMHFHTMPKPLSGSKVGFLNDLFVLPDARGGEVVDALYKELNNFGATKNWPMIRWLTADDNYRARNVYDKLSTRTSWITYQLDIKK